jgi:hypothetical protein
VAYTIQIITAGEPKLGAGLIASLARHWSDDGHRVEIGPARSITADIALMHVDRTHVPPGMVPKNPERRPLLNGAVLDISKRRISANLLTRDSPWQGSVIVKTDANHMGKAEQRVQAKWASDHPLLSGVLRLLGRSAASEVPAAYPVLPGIRSVPASTWRRKDLVVEKFTPEMDGDLFVLRSWVFFGDQGYVRKMFSKDPVIKPRNTVRFVDSDDVPEALMAARQRLGFDFGVFDYVLVEGESILLDVNKTPFIPDYRPAPRRRLASGLYSFLR